MTTPLRWFFVVTFFLIGIWSPIAYGQLVNSSQPIEMEADATGADARTGKVTFTNISIRQGDLSIVADHAESSTLGFDNSTWIFRGNVALKAPESALDANRMTLRFVDKQIKRAVFTGSPLRYTDMVDDGTRVVAQQADVVFARNAIATVELTGSPIELSRAADAEGKRTEGRADTIGYDAQSSNLSLSGNAELSEGANRITGNEITYNLDTRQVLAAANEQGDGKVHIVINPTSDDVAPTSESQEEAPDDIGNNPETKDETTSNE